MGMYSGMALTGVLSEKVMVLQRALGSLVEVRWVTVGSRE
jgi:hypothetical protein